MIYIVLPGSTNDEITCPVGDVAEDHGGDLVVLARNDWQLGRAKQDWPGIRFLTTREHAR